MGEILRPNRDGTAVLVCVPVDYPDEKTIALLSETGHQWRIAEDGHPLLNDFPAIQKCTLVQNRVHKVLVKV